MSSEAPTILNPSHILLGSYLASKYRTRTQNVPVRYKTRWLIQRVSEWQPGDPLPDQYTQIKATDGKRWTLAIEAEIDRCDSKPQAVRLMRDLSNPSTKRTQSSDLSPR